MGLAQKLISNVINYTLVCVFSTLVIIPFLIEAWKRRNKPSSYKERNIEPACLADPKYGKHGFLTLKDHDNLRIHYVANGSNDKPLMFKDYYAVAIDMIGYGKSDKPTAVDKYSSKELSKHIKEVVKELGFESCVLVGHDWSGLVSFGTAADYPEVVKRMILLNTPHMAEWKKSWMSNVKQLLASSYVYFFSFTGPLNYYRNVFSTDTTNAVQLDMPTLIIWGTEDKALMVEQAKLASKYVNHCSVKYIDNAAHFVNLDQPDKVNEYMKEFLRS